MKRQREIASEKESSKASSLCRYFFSGLLPSSAMRQVCPLKILYHKSQFLLPYFSLIGGPSKVILQYVTTKLCQRKQLLSRLYPKCFAKSLRRASHVPLSQNQRACQKVGNGRLCIQWLCDIESSIRNWWTEWRKYCPYSLAYGKGLKVRQRA